MVDVGPLSTELGPVQAGVTQVVSKGPDPTQNAWSDGGGRGLLPRATAALGATQFGALTGADHAPLLRERAAARGPPPLLQLLD
jgi:hypothetical protein